MGVLPSDIVFNKIPSRLAKVDPAERKLTAVFKFNITVDGNVVKTWILDLKNLKIFEGDEAADCTLTIADSDMAAIGQGTLTTKAALHEDKILIDGNIELVMALTPYLGSL